MQLVLESRNTRGPKSVKLRLQALGHNNINFIDQNGSLEITKDGKTAAYQDATDIIVNIKTVGQTDILFSRCGEVKDD